MKCIIDYSSCGRTNGAGQNSTDNSAMQDVVWYKTTHQIKAQITAICTYQTRVPVERYLMKIMFFITDETVTRSSLHDIADTENMRSDMGHEK
jgi:hypothetical protein